MRMMLSGVSIFSLLIPGTAEATPTLASVKDIVLSAKCDISRLALEMRRKNYNIKKFDGVMSFEVAHSTTKKINANLSPFSWGLVSVEGGAGLSSVQKSTQTQKYSFEITSGNKLPSGCSKVAVRLFNKKLQPKRTALWKFEAPGDLETLPKDEMAQAEKLYTGSISIDKKINGKIDINLIIFKLEVGEDAEKTSSNSYSFDFSFQRNPATFPNPSKDGSIVRLGEITSAKK